jgi:hypothetical protein
MAWWATLPGAVTGNSIEFTEQTKTTFSDLFEDDQSAEPRNAPDSIRVSLAKHLDEQ